MIILMVILFLLLLLQRSYQWSIILRCVARYILPCLFCGKARGWNDSQYFKIVLHIDKCQEIRCGTNATCTNTKGSLRCTCNTGFYGDGYNCTGKPVSLLTRLKAIAKDSNSWSLSGKTFKYDVYWCAIRSGIFFLPLAYFFFGKTSALKGLFDLCLVHFINNANHMSLLTLIRNLKLEKKTSDNKKNTNKSQLISENVLTSF